MEELDVFDEYMMPQGRQDRDVVHTKGLWHKTVHCWLYDKLGNVYFQIRTDENKLYTTASGHVRAGETVKQAFHREVLEEVGVSVETSDATLVEIVAWQMNKQRGEKPFIDRAFAHVYIDQVLPDYDAFHFDEQEVLGLIKVKAKDALELLQRENGSIVGEKITNLGVEKINVEHSDFLITSGEYGFVKYGRVLQTIINKTNVQK